MPIPSIPSIALLDKRQQRKSSLSLPHKNKVFKVIISIPFGLKGRDENEIVNYERNKCNKIKRNAFNFIISLIVNDGK